MYFALIYDYVDNVIEKRAPFRENHLSLVKVYQDQGKMLLAGAYTDPLDGALLIFKANSAAEVEQFTIEDPYVQNSLVSRWRIREWNVVAGSLLD
jgi:uncharacterized protein YciI